MTARASRRRTPVHLALGLGLLGLSGYAFVAVVGHVFDAPSQASTVAALVSVYLLVNTVGPGVYAAFEQETSRGVSAALVTRGSAPALARRSAVLAGRTLAGLLLLFAVASPLLLPDVLDGRPLLLVALAFALVGTCGVYWVRGVLGGVQRFDLYARTLYVEGLVRLLPCVLLLVAGVVVAEPYGLAYAAGSAVAALLVLRPALAALRATRLAAGTPETAVPAGRPGPQTRMGRPLAHLAVGVVMSLVLANTAPVLVTYRSADATAAALFASVCVMARVPLFLFAPVQAVVLPRLSAAAARGRHDEVVRLLRLTLAAVVGLGLLGTAGLAVAGPWAATTLFSTASRPSSALFALLGLATLLMLVAMTLHPVLVALDRHRAVAVCWSLGAAAFAATALLPGDPLTWGVAAQLAGPSVAVAALATCLVRALARDPDAVPRQQEVPG